MNVLRLAVICSLLVCPALVSAQTPIDVVHTNTFSQWRIVTVTFDP